MLEGVLVSENFLEKRFTFLDFRYSLEKLRKAGTFLLTNFKNLRKGMVLWYGK